MSIKSHTFVELYYGNLWVVVGDVFGWDSCDLSWVDGWWLRKRTLHVTMIIMQKGVRSVFRVRLCPLIVFIVAPVKRWFVYESPSASSMTSVHDLTYFIRRLWEVIEDDYCEKCPLTVVVFGWDWGLQCNQQPSCAWMWEMESQWTEEGHWMDEWRSNLTPDWMSFHHQKS